VITFGQLFLAVSLPTLVALVGIILNHTGTKEASASVKALSDELKNFRIEMAKELGRIDTRISVIETKLGIPTPPKEQKEAA